MSTGHGEATTFRRSLHRVLRDLRRGERREHRHRDDSGAVVSVAFLCYMLLTCALISLCIMAGIKIARADSSPMGLDEYWSYPGDEQRKVVCMNYTAYPRYARNVTVNYMRWTVTPEEADAFLTEKCLG